MVDRLGPAPSGQTNKLDAFPALGRLLLVRWSQALVRSVVVSYGFGCWDLCPAPVVARVKSGSGYRNVWSHLLQKLGSPGRSRWLHFVPSATPAYRRMAGLFRVLSGTFQVYLVTCFITI